MSTEKTPISQRIQDLLDEIGPPLTAEEWIKAGKPEDPWTGVRDSLDEARGRAMYAEQYVSDAQLAAEVKAEMFK